MRHGQCWDEEAEQELVRLLETSTGVRFVTGRSSGIATDGGVGSGRAGADFEERWVCGVTPTCGDAQSGDVQGRGREACIKVAKMQHHVGQEA
jgi:hypothetical protein